jgi:hypothetical protein
MTLRLIRLMTARAPHGIARVQSPETRRLRPTPAGRHGPGVYVWDEDEREAEQCARKLAGAMWWEAAR